MSQLEVAAIDPMRADGGLHRGQLERWEKLERFRILIIGELSRLLWGKVKEREKSLWITLGFLAKLAIF